jgi:hypothetical protein
MQSDFFMKAQGWRGLAEPAPLIQLGDGDRSFRDMWKEMFFSFDDSQSIVLAFSLPGAKQRQLTISYDASEEGRKVILTPAGDQTPSVVTPLLFEGRSETGKTFHGRVAVTAQGTIPLPQFAEPYRMAFLPPAALLNSQSTARLFSDLSKREQHRPVVEAVKSLFPVVLGLSVEVQGGSNAIFASVRGFLRNCTWAHFLLVLTNTLRHCWSSRRNQEGRLGWMNSRMVFTTGTLRLFGRASLSLAA